MFSKTLTNLNINEWTENAKLMLIQNMNTNLTIQNSRALLTQTHPLVFAARLKASIATWEKEAKEKISETVANSNLSREEKTFVTTTLHQSVDKVVAKTKKDLKLNDEEAESN